MSAGAWLSGIATTIGIIESMNGLLVGHGAVARSRPPDPIELPRSTLLVIYVEKNGLDLDSVLSTIESQSAYRKDHNQINIVFSVAPHISFHATRSELVDYPVMSQRKVKQLVRLDTGLSLAATIDQELGREELVVLVHPRANLPPHWLFNHMKRYDNPDTIAVSGPIMGPPGPQMLVEGFTNHIRKPNLSNLSFRSDYFRLVTRRMTDSNEVFCELMGMGRLVWDVGVGFRLFNGTQRPTPVTTPSVSPRTEVAEIYSILEQLEGHLTNEELLGHFKRLHHLNNLIGGTS